MTSKKVRWIIIITSGLFLLTDQILKWQALNNWSTPKLIFPNFGWQLFLNKGVAFSLPLLSSLTVLITLPIIGLLAYLLINELLKKDSSNIKLLAAWSMALAGSISNLLDRIFYHQVVDYFIIGTAVINIGDILIVGGLVIYLISIKTIK